MYALRFCMGPSNKSKKRGLLFLGTTLKMNDTFIITVLSFALVLAVVASLFVWVILPALEEEGIVTKKGNNSIQELQDDVEDSINKINRQAYQYDIDQQAVIDKNKADILALQTRLNAHVPSTGVGGHVAATPVQSPMTPLIIPVSGAVPGASASTTANPVTFSIGQTSQNSNQGVSSANQATVSFQDGTWTIQQGDVSYKANQTHICGSPSNCISRTN